MKHILPLAALILLVSASSQLMSASSSNDSPYKPKYRYTGPQSGSISEDEAQGKDPILATVFALLPGVFLHGTGNYYSENFEFGNRMLAMEILGVGVSVFGYSLMHNPDGWQKYFGGNDNTMQAGYWVKAGGITMLVISWIGDLATASDSAIQYNRDHQLNFQLESRLDNPGLMLTCNF